jgi:hypothetical protein
MHARATDAAPSFEPLGESTLLVRFGSHIEPSLNARVHATVTALRAAMLPGVDDIVPAYASLALHYRPMDWEAGGGSAWRADFRARAARGPALRDGNLTGPAWALPSGEDRSS